MADETKAKIEREARWWAEWFAADYSWKGLTAYRILGGGLHGEKTLQDYWRRDPANGRARTDSELKKLGELVEFDGSWWHEAHLPLRNPQGNLETWKVSPDHERWAVLSKMLSDRVKASQETAGSFYGGNWLPEAHDGRAQFDGGVLGSALDGVNVGVSSVNMTCEIGWLGKVSATRWRFGFGTCFDRAWFSGEANFDNVIFSKDSSFYGSVFIDKAKFTSSNFQGGASFHCSVFFGEADFIWTSFSGDISFGEVKFHDSALFNCAKFSKRLWFSDPSDDHSFGAGVKVDFASVIFEGGVSFDSTIAEPELDFSGAFYAARFLDVADFSGAVAPEQAGRLAAAFDEAQFEKVLILTDGSDRQARSYFHDVVLPKTLGAADGRDIRLRQLEAGCRAVKIAMGRARDELREQRYYRFQLRARQMRSDIDWWEKCFGWLYGVMSDFGSSLWRPLVCLVGFMVLSGLGYFAWAAWLDVAGDGGFWDGQGMALAAVFKPFSALGDVSVPRNGHPSFSIALMGVNPAVALGVRLATTLQSLLSGALIFLFALAVKRRFQIS